MPRPRRPTLAPIAKLAQLVKDKGETDMDQKMPYRQKKAFLAKFEPGGPLADFAFHAASLTMIPDRVHYIAQLMATGQWRLPMVGVLSKAWDVDPKKVAQWREEAGRMLALSMGDREMLKNTAMALLDRIAHDALENGDRRSAVTAVRTFAELGGLIKHQTEITGADGAPIAILAAVKSLSNEELEAEIARAAERRAAAQAEMTGEIVPSIPQLPQPEPLDGDIDEG